MGQKVIAALGDYGCDTQTALERFLGKEELYLKFIKKFLDDKSFEELKGHIADSDYENALKSVHTLKGVSGNLGFTALYDVASDMVTKFRASQELDAVAEYGKLEQIYTEIYSIIKENIS
ncbi:MAG: Hpt domain-containing protein [Lachnospiraceae bacterium]|nr:Hpt domain-containing protein [Lachnospiraceae bacterium]